MAGFTVRENDYQPLDRFDNFLGQLAKSNLQNQGQEADMMRTAHEKAGVTGAFKPYYDAISAGNLTPDEEQKLQYSTVMNLISQGTPSATAAAGVVEKMHTPKAFNFGSPTIVGGNNVIPVSDPATGQTKLNILGPASPKDLNFAPKNPTEDAAFLSGYPQTPEGQKQGAIDLINAKAVASAKSANAKPDPVDVFQKKEDLRTATKYYTDYHDATAKIKGIKGQYETGGQSMDQIIAAANQDPDYRNLKDHPELFLGLPDPAKRKRYNDIGTYEKAQSALEAANSGLAGLSKRINKFGALEDFDPSVAPQQQKAAGYSSSPTTSAPKGTKRGYFNQ